MAHRLPSLDVLRGLALLGMIVFHGAYDLATYWQFLIAIDQGAWKLFARAVAVLFLLVSGMAIALSEERMTEHAAADRWKRRARRAALTGAAALAVSLATYIADPDTYVRFGILHLAAVSRLLLPLFLPLRGGMLLGALFLLVSTGGPWQTETSLLLPLGLIPVGFASVDYFPLIPWFGVVLLGAGMLSVHDIRQALSSPLPSLFPLRLLELAGRHTLLVYLAHQPILIGMLWLFLR